MRNHFNSLKLQIFHKQNIFNIFNMPLLYSSQNIFSIKVHPKCKNEGGAIIVFAT